jgi:hypothetical protein
MPYCVLEKGEMRHFPKEKAALAVVVSSIILFAFMFLVTKNNIANVSAVEANGVGVYWDSHCTDTVSSIDWGHLTPGSVKNVVVYIRNEVEEPLYLILSTMNWNPSKAFDYNYITLRWDYSGQRTNPSEALKITLILSVNRYIEGISIFSFDIVIIGSQRMPGDVDGDGDVDGSDMRKVILAMFTAPGDTNWNPNADMDYDEDVDGGDQKICQNHMFKSW